MPKPKKSKPVDSETAVDEILEAIDQHELSSSKVQRSTTRHFWSSIVHELQIRLSALNEDDEREKRGG